MSVDLSALSALPRLAASATEPQHAAAIRVDRACTELRRGRPLALRTDAGWLLAAAVETLSTNLWQQLQATGAAARLLLSAERLQALDADAPAAPRARALAADTSLLQLQQWAAVTAGPGDPSLLGTPEAAPGEAQAWAAGLALCKRARLIPALLLLALPADAGPALASAQLMAFDPADAMAALPGRAARLQRVSDARVPLAVEEDCTLVVFRELDGDAEHVAIIVGQPPVNTPNSAPVPVRLHSACLTGDLLGSLRCDCGPQLQRAVARLAETGGVLLYLAQEGRATGLANKLRAYRLQDTGLDTLQADRYLGFREDERDFAAAAAMLQALGHTRIQLLTNNPQKISALRQAGIAVIDRLPLHGQVNSHNERYIRTKQQAGHLGGDD
jgi:GTP cyclohydrolase II